MRLDNTGLFCARDLGRDYMNLANTGLVGQHSVEPAQMKVLRDSTKSTNPQII